MSEIKHIQLQHELPIGQRFTLDTWPDKTFEVVKAEGQEERDRAFRIDRCDGCFFQHGRLVKDGYVDDCGTFFLCNGNDRQDKTYVVFEEVQFPADKPVGSIVVFPYSPKLKVVRGNPDPCCGGCYFVNKPFCPYTRNEFYCTPDEREDGNWIIFEEVKE